MKKFKKALFLTSAASMALVMAACGQEEEGEEETGSGEESVEEADGELTVYTSRNEDFVGPLLDKFTEDTGVEVNMLALDDNAVNRIKGEENNVQSDIFISNDVGALEHLRLEGFLQEAEPENIDSIDEIYRAEDNSWFALSARTRVLMYNKDMITEEEMPEQIEDLTDEEYEGEFAITRGGNGGMIGHVSALRQEWGDEETSEWINGVQDNAAAILDGHGDIRRGVGAGEFAFGLVNNYYYHQQLQEPTDKIGRAHV